AAGHDDAAARAAQGLVGGGGDHVCVRHRVRVHARGHQAGDVGHVHEQVRAHGVGDGAEARPVDLLRVGAEPGHDHLRAVLAGQALDLVVVDQAVVVDAVLDGVEQLVADVDPGAVGQVDAVRQLHTEDGVARLQQGQVHVLVCLRAVMGLDVGVVGAEELPGAVDGQLLRHVDVLAAAVVALAGVPLGVLVGELAALGLHDPRAGVVLAGDQLDVVLLAAVLGGDRRGQFRTVAFDACVAREHLRSRGRGDGHCSPRPGPRGPGRGTVRTGPDATGPGPPGPPERFAGGT